MPRGPKFEDPPFDHPPEGGGEVPFQPRPNAPASATAAILRKHEAQLLAMPGVKGAGESAGPIGEPVIEVFVADAGAAKAVPRSLDGVEVVTRIVGEVDAYQRTPRRKR